MPILVYQISKGLKIMLPSICWNGTHTEGGVYVTANPARGQADIMY